MPRQKWFIDGSTIKHLFNSGMDYANLLLRNNANKSQIDCTASAILTCNKKS